MFIFKTLSFIRFIAFVLPSVVFCANSARSDDSACSNIEPQPIGIDFGPGVMSDSPLSRNILHQLTDFSTATYAHALDNITAIAVVGARDDEPYARHMFRLRLENYAHMNISQLFESQQAPETLLGLLWGIGKNYFFRLTSRMTFLDRAEFNDSTTVKWIRETSNGIINAVNSLWLKATFKWPEEITHEDIKAGFVSMLEVVRASALQHHNTTINFAILSVPDFFNGTISNLAIEACKEVGIQTTEKTIVRTVMGAWGARNMEDENAANDRILILDQGKFHLAIRTYQEKENSEKRILQRYLPLDSLGSHSIDMQLVERVIRAPGVLRDQIQQGADRSRLQYELARARLLIHDNLDTQMGLGLNEDHHHEEWPLELKDWWIGDEQGAVLAWEDVRIVEDEYVASLSDLIFKFLVSCRRKFPVSSGHEFLENADGKNRG